MSRACQFNKRDKLKLLAHVGTVFPEEQPAAGKVQFMKEELHQTHTDHTDWTQHSEHNGPAGKKRPVDTFVQTKTNISSESAHNVNIGVHDVGPEFPLQTDTRSILGNSTNSPNSTGVYNAEQNEFSDHSDAESFARLSESVFEAIEDTQDSIIGQHATDGRATEKAAKSKRTRACPVCGKTYTASSSYFYHMKHFHRQSKEHSCDVCGKRFGTRGDLEQHAAVHSEECKYACRSCSKRFRSRASWYIHEQIHEGVKQYKCSTCEKCFRWRTHLQRHALRHAAEKKHACAVCGRGFSVRCDLLRHARTHAVGSFQCDECHGSFAQMRYLKAHIRKKHCLPAHDKG